MTKAPTLEQIAKSWAIASDHHLADLTAAVRDVMQQTVLDIDERVGERIHKLENQVTELTALVGGLVRQLDQLHERQEAQERHIYRRQPFESEIEDSTQP